MNIKEDQGKIIKIKTKCNKQKREKKVCTGIYSSQGHGNKLKLWKEEEIDHVCVITRNNLNVFSKKT